MSTKLEKIVAGTAILAGFVICSLGLYNSIKYDSINKKVAGIYAGIGIGGAVAFSAGADYLWPKKKK